MAPPAHDPYITPLLTDLYQITMAYAHFCNGGAERRAVFEMFFRRCPFKGEYAVFAGLRKVLEFVHEFKFDEEDLDYVVKVLHLTPATREIDNQFIDYLRHLNCDEVTIQAPPEGTLVFANEPIYIVSGPLIICQLLETTILALTNFPTLIATNAARFRQAAGDKAVLLEFGLRRAQATNGAMSASLYSVMGGFDATSNVMAGALYHIPVSGTMAHAFIQSYNSIDELNALYEKADENKKAEYSAFRDRCMRWRKFYIDSVPNIESTTISRSQSFSNLLDSSTSSFSTSLVSPDSVLNVPSIEKELVEEVPSEVTTNQSGRFVEELSHIYNKPCNIDALINGTQMLSKSRISQTNEGELASFISYGFAFPDAFSSLVDTYHVLESGVLNYIIVATALCEMHIENKNPDNLKLGIRLDSGDLAFLSLAARTMIATAADILETAGFVEIAKHLQEKTKISASNDIDEEILQSLNAQGHSIDCFGIGTKLVTCSAQPSLGGVYKLVELDGIPRIKFSEDRIKVTIPGKKVVYRLFTKEKGPYVDLICHEDDEKETYPVAKKTIKCFSKDESLSVLVRPSLVQKVHTTVYCPAKNIYGDVHIKRDLAEIRTYIRKQQKMLRPDHVRFVNPTPYKVSITARMGEIFRSLLEKNVTKVHIEE